MSSQVDRSSMLKLPKLLLHEHLDCSLRPSTMLELWHRVGFEKAPANLPSACVELWRSGNKAAAAIAYQKFLQQEASASLAHYLAAIGQHVLPLMQTREELTRHTRERLEDAFADGVIGMHLRFAPQLHTQQGLTLADVMEAVIAGLEGSKLPVSLEICCLRHEDEQMAKRLVDLAIEYRSHVGLIDLAGDEQAFPGVLEWWAREAVRARDFGIDLDLHLWETNEPSAEDLVKLAEFQIDRIGHGFRGQLQDKRILEVCPSSNVVTGQVESIAKHPVDKLLKSGSVVTINTDGTLFTGSDLSNEYMLLANNFAWGLKEFAQINQNALAACVFSDSVKKDLAASLKQSYGCEFASR